jgi:hypothetical protein
MGTVNIGGTQFEIYGAFVDANTYFLANSNAAAWRDADGLTRNRALVTSARSFDRQSWVGDMVDPTTPQPLAWPRTGVTDRNGQAATFPQDVIEGSWEWALEIIKNPAVANSTPGSNTKRTRTKDKVDVIEVEAEIEFFKSTLGRGARFSTAVMELVGLFLSSSQGTTLAFVSGTDVDSGFTASDTDFGFDGNGLDGGANA